MPFSLPPPSPSARATDVRNRFASRFGRPPAGVWVAPGRANLIGEHTDYNAGFVLPFAIERSAYAAVALREDGVLRLVSEQSGEVSLQLADLAPGRITGWPAYVAGAVWALGESHGAHTRGLDLLLDSDVPSGAGLSSSAALECVTALAVVELLGIELPRPALALAAHRAEVEMAGVPCGTMDQMISMCGQAERALFLDCRSLEIRQVPLPLASMGLALLVIDTRAPHRLVSGEYAARRRDCEAAAAALGVAALRDTTAEAVEAAAGLSELQRNRARHVVTENARVLATVAALERGDLGAAGPLLNASHESLRRDFEVTVPELDVAAAAAVEGGALGARMIGGGFGGCVLALVEADGAEATFAAVERAFGKRGFAAPVGMLAQPSAGARRLS